MQSTHDPKRSEGGARILYIGIDKYVIALDAVSGAEIWRTQLKKWGDGFVGIHEAFGRIFASSRGELFCLDPANGEILWHNELKGLGDGYITYAGENTTTIAAAAARQQAAAASAG